MEVMMELGAYFKSIIEQDRTAVVICNLSHEIIYMNPAAVEKFGKRGGSALLGRSLLDCHNDNSREMIAKVVAWFSESKDNNIVHTLYRENENKDVYMVALRDDSGELIGYYEKHEFRNRDAGGLYSEME
jgi:PAS domain-containing protein